jgi:hypothetical protein
MEIPPFCVVSVARHLEIEADVPVLVIVGVRAARANAAAGSLDAHA